MKKNYNWVTEIKYMNFVNWVSEKIKSIRDLLNIDKDKKETLLLLAGWYNKCL